MVLSASRETSQPFLQKTPQTNKKKTVTQTETFNSSDASRVCCAFLSELP